MSSAAPDAWRTTAGAHMHDARDDRNRNRLRDAHHAVTAAGAPPRDALRVVLERMQGFSPIAQALPAAAWRAAGLSQMPAAPLPERPRADVHRALAATIAVDPQPDVAAFAANMAREALSGGWDRQAWPLLAALAVAYGEEPNDIARLRLSETVLETPPARRPPPRDVIRILEQTWSDHQHGPRGYRDLLQPIIDPILLAAGRADPPAVVGMRQAHRRHDRAPEALPQPLASDWAVMADTGIDAQHVPIIAAALLDVRPGWSGSEHRLPQITCSHHRVGQALVASDPGVVAELLAHNPEQMAPQLDEALRTQEPLRVRSLVDGLAAHPHAGARWFAAHATRFGARRDPQDANPHQGLAWAANRLERLSRDVSTHVVEAAADRWLALPAPVRRDQDALVLGRQAAARVTAGTPDRTTVVALDQALRHVATDAPAGLDLAATYANQAAHQEQAQIAQSAAQWLGHGDGAIHSRALALVAEAAPHDPTSRETLVRWVQRGNWAAMTYADVVGADDRVAQTLLGRPYFDRDSSWTTGMSAQASESRHLAAHQTLASWDMEHNGRISSGLRQTILWAHEVAATDAGLAARVQSYIRINGGASGGYPASGAGDTELQAAGLAVVLASGMSSDTTSSIPYRLHQCLQSETLVAGDLNRLRVGMQTGSRRDPQHPLILALKAEASTLLAHQRDDIAAAAAGIVLDPCAPG